MKNILYATSVISAVFIIFGVNSLFLSNENTEDNDITELQVLGMGIVDEHDRFSYLIDRLGVLQAYENFKDAYEPHNFKTQHAAAHIFGEVLYESEGIPGVAICDGTFSFGCYHSFFLKALSEQGKEIILEMDRACIEKHGLKGLGCQHGLGHGLIEYMGPGGLLEALDACATLAWKEPFFGCQEGVFMEYNFPTIFDAENSISTIRNIDEERPYDVCPELTQRFRQACYYSLGQWWKKSFSYEKIGQLCDATVSEKEREACYLGVGSVVASSSSYDVAESISQCKKMPDFVGELVCRAGASWAFFALPEYRPLSPELCKTLKGSSKDVCLQKSDLVGEKGL